MDHQQKMNQLREILNGMTFNEALALLQASQIELANQRNENFYWAPPIAANPEPQQTELPLEKVEAEVIKEAPAKKTTKKKTKKKTAKKEEIELVAEPSPEETKGPLTIDDVRNVAAKYANKYGRPAAGEVLSKLEVKKLVNLKAEQYPQAYALFSEV